MNFKEMCRTCLRSGEMMSSLFDEEVESAKLTAADLLAMFTFVQISTETDFPDHICLSCLDEIHRAYAFKLKCEKSEIILLQLKERNVSLKDQMEFTNSCSITSESTGMSQSSVKESSNSKEMALSDGNNATEDSGIPSNKNIELEYCSPDFQASIKHEPELDIDVSYENIDWNDSESEDEELLNCPACAKDFQSLEIFRKHIERNHLEGNFCILCNAGFECGQSEHSVKHFPGSYLNDLAYENAETNYVESDSGGANVFKCSICPNESFIFRADLARHNLKIHSSASGVKCCGVCSELLPNEKEFLSHMRKIHNCKKPFKCYLCDGKYQREHSLRYHLRTKHSQEISAIGAHQCDICLKIEPNRLSYIEHVRSCHTFEGRLQCELCSKKFRNCFTFRTHLDGEHESDILIDKPKYKCDICSKIFAYKYNLINHIRIHTGERPFQCKLCSHEFRYKKSLKGHLQMKHTDADEEAGVKPDHQCNFCLKTFGSNYHLSRHMRTHTGEKPYKCDICFKAFQQKQDLTKHLHTKSGQSCLKFRLNSVYRQY